MNTHVQRILTALLALTFTAGLAACDSKKKADDKADKQASAKEADKSEKSDDQTDNQQQAGPTGLSAQERENLQKQYDKQAEEEITPENADKMAEQLEKEIEGDL